MNKNQFVIVLLVIHLIAALLTYGHAYHAPSVSHSKLPDGTVFENMAGTRIVGAGFCGLFWPLYWSAHLMQPKEQP